MVANSGMTRRFSHSLKRQLVARLSGVNSVSAAQLARETGISQQNLSRWLAEARSRPLADAGDEELCTWTVGQKARILVRAELLSGDELTVYLDGEGVQKIHYERWRRALEAAGVEDVSAAKRIARLERDLVRKERALAEAATLLILREPVEHEFQHKPNGDDTQEKEHELALA